MTWGDDKDSNNDWDDEDGDEDCNDEDKNGDKATPMKMTSVYIRLNVY